MKEEGVKADLDNPAKEYYGRSAWLSQRRALELTQADLTPNGWTLPRIVAQQ